MLLGIDTGGTYTDAVVYDETTRAVVAKAKAPTTHHDLSIGIRQAIDLALRNALVDPAAIELVSMSTTLATNALVEGKGRPIAAIIIGFGTDVLTLAGLAEALGGDPVIVVAGGHDPHGGEVAAVDLEALETRILAIAGRVDAFAVTAQFSVRNPAHEEAAAEVVRRVAGKPVTMSHHLSAQLNGPKRAVTAILNARLISIVDELVHTTERTLAEHGIHAPLMVVRGDGSLVSAEFVRDRPIETILSGPAASLVGAAHLTGVSDAIIADIGGTTTDIAVLRDGAPTVSPDGASVGGHQTMVSAVVMHTHGLGGDSRVQHDERAAGAVLLIGPRRVVPLCQLAVSEPALVHEMLDRHLAYLSPIEHDGMLLIAEQYHEKVAVLAGAEHDLLIKMGGRAAPASAVLHGMQQRSVADRLVRRGVLHYAAFTPTDAAHVLGLQDTYDVGAAGKAAELFSRSRDRMGKPIAADGRCVAQMTIDTLVRRSAEAVLAAAFIHDGLPGATVSTVLVQRALDRSLSAVQASIGLTAPLVALGASAPAYYPSVAALLGAESNIPDDADVANAVGAVVGRVRISRQCTISSPHLGQFVAHADETPALFADLDAARRFADEHVAAALRVDMTTAGAPAFELRSEWHEKVVDIGGMAMFVEGTLTLTASGRPQLAGSTAS
jgi:N-methylhydantoinase A/oxoprolinase/acetone carboxylase beta subunit